MRRGNRRRANYPSRRTFPRQPTTHNPSNARGVAGCWCWWNDGGRDNVQPGAVKTVRLPELMKLHAPESTVWACPAQTVRATRTGEVCSWGAGRGGEGARDEGKGHSVAVPWGWKCADGMWPGDDGEGKWLGTVRTAGEVGTLSAKRAADGPGNV